jgi:UDP-N-acetylglucosamine diphosphorylase/glucosamine-1-phosphate N-acetyltransferase
MKTNVLILAGGLGKRMKSDLPKVLHKINDKSMLSNIISKVNFLNINKIYIVVGKYQDIIESALKSEIPEIFHKINFVIQEMALGTGHTIICAKNQIPDEPNTNLLVLNGDAPLIRTQTLRELIHKYTILNSSALIATITLNNPSGYGRIYTNQNNYAINVVEEKDCTKEQKLIKKVNAGIYLFNQSKLFELSNHLNNNNSQKEYYITDFVSIFSNNGINVSYYEVNDTNELLNINTKEALEQAKRFL